MKLSQDAIERLIKLFDPEQVKAILRYTDLNKSGAADQLLSQLDKSRQATPDIQNALARLQAAREEFQAALKALEHHTPAAESPAPFDPFPGHKAAPVHISQQFVNNLYAAFGSARAAKIVQRLQQGPHKTDWLGPFPGRNK